MKSCVSVGESKSTTAYSGVLFTHKYKCSAVKTGTWQPVCCIEMENAESRQNVGVMRAGNRSQRLRKRGQALQTEHYLSVDVLRGTDIM